MMDYSFDRGEENRELDNESLLSRWESILEFPPHSDIGDIPLRPRIDTRRIEPTLFQRGSHGDPSSREDPNPDGASLPPIPPTNEQFAQLRNPSRIESLAFSSKAEAVCGMMLEKYVPGFRLITGETFQIPVGSKKIDFKVGGVYIEFHPVQLRHDFTSQNAYQKFQAALGRLEDWQRQDLAEILQEEFEGQYTKRRRDILNSFAQTKNAELIVCHDREDFVRRVLRRFGGPGLPSETKLLREFEKLYRQMHRRFHHEDPGSSAQ